MKWDGFMMNCVIAFDIVFLVTLLSMVMGASLVSAFNSLNRDEKVPSFCIIVLLFLCFAGMFSINFFLLSHGVSK